MRYQYVTENKGKKVNWINCFPTGPGDIFDLGRISAKVLPEFVNSHDNEIFDCVCFDMEKLLRFIRGKYL